MRKIVALYLVVLSFSVNAQCDSVSVTGDLTVNSTALMSGVYVVDGVFTVAAGATIFVTPYNSNGCGELKIYAEEIYVYGDINGDFSGYSGGTGGAKGLDVTSATGHAASLTSCTDEGSEGHISVAGGYGGSDGEGPGGGNGGNNGQSGSGSKQYCGNFGDEAGVVGGAGGAGGGSGGSYGGVGSTGGAGGSGSNSYSVTDLDVENSYTPTAGNGGIGGTSSAVYGTSAGLDISMGSGGAGAGGGGRSHYLGTDGLRGGHGGGLIFLKADSDVVIEGQITANGENGSNGGNGGSGDTTEDCCSDGCNGCDERTLSCGSGAGSGSGGGSGGGILIEAGENLTFSGVLIAKGGNGGTGGQRGYGATCDYGGGGFCSENSISTEQGNNGGSGGAGGGGRIKIFVPDCANALITGNYNVSGGTGAAGGGDGSYAEICGYLMTDDLESSELLIYPNPFRTDIKIEIKSVLRTEIRLMNQLGQMIHSETCQEETCAIDLSHLNSGVYIIQLTNEQGVVTSKITKE